MKDINTEIDTTKSIMSIVKSVEEAAIQMDLDDEEILDSIEKLKKFTQNYYFRLVNQT